MDEAGRLLEAFWRGMALHLWQTTLILAPMLLLARLMRRAPAGQIHLLWWIALIKLLLPLSLLEPIMGAAWGWIVRGWPAEGGATAVRVVEYVRVALHPTALGGAAPLDPFGSSGRVYFLLTLSWGAGMALLTWSWSRGRGPFRREYPHTMETVAPALRVKLASALRGTEIPSRRIRLGPTLRVPAVVGLFRPTILVPERIVAALEAEELRGVLLHEESHRRRRDPALALVKRCALLLFFFYPPVWWLVRRMSQSAEIACDESVLARGVSPATYARALSRTLGLNLLPPYLAATTGLGRPAGLRRRLERIESSWRYRVMPEHRWFLSAALLLVIGPGLAGTMSAEGPSGTAPGVVATVLNPEASDRFSDLDRLKASDVPVQLGLTNVPLEEVFEALERTTGLRVQVEGTLPHCREIRLLKMPLDEALVYIALEYDLLYDVIDWDTLKVRHPLPAGIDGVTNPEIIPASKVVPVYPEEARKAGVTGQVVLQAVILEDGTVTSIRPLREVPAAPSLTASAIDAVSQWRYEPALLDGRPVEVFFTVVIQFSLDDDKSDRDG